MYCVHESGKGAVRTWKLVDDQDHKTVAIYYNKEAALVAQDAYNQSQVKQRIVEEKDLVSAKLSPEMQQIYNDNTPPLTSFFKVPLDMNLDSEWFMCGDFVTLARGKASAASIFMTSPRFKNEFPNYSQLDVESCTIITPAAFEEWLTSGEGWEKVDRSTVRRKVPTGWLYASSPRALATFVPVPGAGVYRVI